MLELLQFVFRDFWTFAGTTVLLSIVIGGLVGFAASLPGRRGE